MSDDWILTKDLTNAGTWFDYYSPTTIIKLHMSIADDLYKEFDLDTYKKIMQIINKRFGYEQP